VNANNNGKMGEGGSQPTRAHVYLEKKKKNDHKKPMAREKGECITGTKKRGA